MDDRTPRFLADQTRDDYADQTSADMASDEDTKPAPATAEPGALTNADLAAIHTPVLLEDCVDLVTSRLVERHAASTPPIIVDCTLGLAGHSLAFLAACPTARLIGIDRDPQALALATRRIADAGFADRFTPVHAAFDEFSDVLARLGIDRVDGVFMDLGLSSLQIDEADRGFSYSHDAPLDMRMDTTQTLTAADVLNTYSTERLRMIFKEYGEERFAGLIVKRIGEERRETPLTTSQQLNDLVDRTVPRAHRAPGNPAKRVFQALRIEVNGELDKLAGTLPQAALHLGVGGRLVVESYHSLEDRTVKRFMALGLHVDAPADLPVVPPDAQPFFRDLTHGAIKADDAEKQRNPRSSSVRLRAVELTKPIPPARRQELAGLIDAGYAGFAGGAPGAGSQGKRGGAKHEGKHGRGDRASRSSGRSSGTFGRNRSGRSQSEHSGHSDKERTSRR